MIVTARYLGVKKGSWKYLFLYLSEDYQDQNHIIRNSLRPIIKSFARSLMGNGAVVVPFSGDNTDNLGDMLEKDGWLPHESDIWEWFRNNGPAILIIDRDVDEFTPKHHPYIMISLRDGLDPTGAAKVFELQEMFNLLVDKARDTNLFAAAPPELLALERKQFWKVVEMKPGIWGFSIDLPSAFKWLRQKRIRTHQYG